MKFTLSAMMFVVSMGVACSFLTFTLGLTSNWIGKSSCDPENIVTCGTYRADVLKKLRLSYDDKIGKGKRWGAESRANMVLNEAKDLNIDIFSNCVEPEKVEKRKPENKKGLYKFFSNFRGEQRWYDCYQSSLPTNDKLLLDPQ